MKAGILIEPWKLVHFEGPLRGARKTFLCPINLAEPLQHGGGESAECGE